jgi:hypothetical protein
LAFALVAALSGCGTTKSQTATEQLLTSDAVDQAVAHIDFRPLAGRKVYFDTTYIPPASAGKDAGFANAPYIISSLRQQMMAAGCYLQEKQETAEFIVEARIGAMGADAHEVTYGIPASNALSSAAEVMAPAAPPLPAIPELSFAKRADRRAAAKLAVFAYHRETRQALWQSGITQVSSNAKDVWLLGVGPFHRGSIYDGTEFAGSKLEVPLVSGSEGDEVRPPIVYDDAHIFDALRREQQDSVRVVSFDEPVADEAQVTEAKP